MSSRELERRKARLLNGLDARELIRFHYPEVARHLTPDQIDKVQRVLDAFVINQDVDSQLLELDRKSVVGHTRGGHAVHDDARRASPDSLRKVASNRISVKEGDSVIKLDFEKLLAQDALKPTSDNPDEAAYLLKVKSALASQGVWLRVFRNSSQMGRTQYSAPDDPRGWMVVMWIGSDRSRTISTSTGQLTRVALFNGTTFGAGYYDYVRNGPTLRLLRAAIVSVRSKINLMVAIHNDCKPQSVRGRILDWALREAVGNGTLGRSVELPSETIWIEPAQILKMASDLIDEGKLMEANKLVVLASYQAEWAAYALMQYVQFVNDIKPGVGIALEILKVADLLGDIAGAVLIVRAAGQRAIRLLAGKGGTPALPTPGTSTPARQLPAGPATSETAAYESAVQQAEIRIKSAVTPPRTPAPVTPAPASGANGAQGRTGSIGATPYTPPPSKSLAGGPRDRWGSANDMQEVINKVRVQNGMKPVPAKTNSGPLGLHNDALVQKAHDEFMRWLAANPGASLEQKIAQFDRLQEVRRLAGQPLN